VKGIEGATAVVTGAGRGNGRAIALGLSRAGSSVAVWDIDGVAARETAAMIEAEGATVRTWSVDVADPGSVQNAAAEVAEALGNTAILVNNAGIIRRQPFADRDFDAGWEETFRVNVHGVKNVTSALLPQLRKTAGRIVNLASIMSLTTGPGISAYAASKGAVAQFTKALSHDLAADGIRVNAIAPGVIATPMTVATRENPDAIGRFMAHTPLGRVGQPEELVGPVLFLASDMSSYVTGTILPVDGGYLAA
jgi:NAD(P)-dependent dehydrogenase (short-subunit alcohol dehydrogenase family)